MKIFLLMFFSLTALGMQPKLAEAAQNHAKIRETVSNFVRIQTQALPGKATFQVEDIDSRISLPACRTLEAFLPAGGQLNGISSVGVRCIEGQNWSLFVRVNVKISISMLTLKRTMQAGQTIQAEDIGSFNSESIQAGTLSEPNQAVGMVMKYSVGAGQILRHDMLRAPYTVKQGQSVQLRIEGSGFSVNSEGQALNNAAEGERATARTQSGQIINGIAKNGMIHIIQ